MIMKRQLAPAAPCRLARRVHGLLLVVWLGSAHMALAQPKISTQPKSVAVLLGSNATFRVTATGTAPLTYRWQSDCRELADCTNSSLVVSNVALADFGSYTVAVRDADGQTVSQPAWLKLARWSDLVVFDASISMAEYCNGKSWVESFAERACLSASGQVKPRATGGATCADVHNQITTYLRANTPGPNTLLAPWWAGMTADLLSNYRPVAEVVSNYAGNLTLLAKGGGKLFVLPTLVPLYLNPGLDSAYARSLNYADINARMDQEIAKIQVDYGVTCFRFDFAQLSSNVLSNPTAYGFTNVTGLWCDGTHPSWAFSRIISDATYDFLTAALVLAPPVRNANGTVSLQWQGGSGPFRLQYSEDLASGLWQSGDLSFVPTAELTNSSVQQFFRVLQLGQ